MEEMLKKGVHFGYSATTLNPKMKPFIFAYRNNTEIFDLEKILNQLSLAKEFLTALGKEKKPILFVGTKKEIKKSTENFAKELNMSYVTERWLGGTLTNFKEIKGRIDYLNDLYKKRESGDFEKYTKKERLQIERKITKLNKYLAGIKQCQGLPAALIVVDSNYEKTAVNEAKKTKIPLVVIMNSDCNPEDADYLIPANDSSVSSVNFLLRELVDAYKEGLKYDNNGTN
ncbi:MAG: 30S ribosomal protein S2 [Candidatus Parcubacteria bacterium]|nr:30S ribosomal protein S2 [Candidatus Parcubacteria bacterium]